MPSDFKFRDLSLCSMQPPVKYTQRVCCVMQAVVQIWNFLLLLLGNTVPFLPWTPCVFLHCVHLFLSILENVRHSCIHTFPAVSISTPCHGLERGLEDAWGSRSSAPVLPFSEGSRLLRLSLKRAPYFFSNFTSVYGRSMNPAPAAGIHPTSQSYDYCLT